MTKLHNLAEEGQAIWLDYIRRSFIESGDLEKWVGRGLRGETSNPSIFEKAIAGSIDYDEQLKQLAEKDLSDKEIYKALAIEDIQRATDTFRPVYDETNGADGYISLEASPDLAYDTEGTIAEARELFELVERPNVMIKVPATSEGFPAIKTLIGEGRNINITLMFSLAQYDAVAEAYLSGLEKLAKAGGDLSQVHSVASFFISRIDVKVDQRLDEIGNQELRGKIGIANAKMAYQRFKQTFSGERWERLKDKGANIQRVLWASTSVKDPAYPDTMYVDGLIGPHTINTLPLETIKAFLDHGTIEQTLEKELDEAHDQLDKLAEIGIDLDEVTDQLLEEGVDKFADSFDSLLESIGEKREQLLAKQEEVLSLTK